MRSMDENKILQAAFSWVRAKAATLVSMRPQADTTSESSMNNNGV